MDRRNYFLIIFLVIVALASTVFIVAKQKSSLADTLKPVVIGDVAVSDNQLINNAVDDLASTQKEAQEQVKALELKISQKKDILNSTVNEVLVKSGKDWRIDTIVEKDSKLRTYQFVKRDQPIPLAETKPQTEEKK
jgi:hypothetical protein